MLLLQMPCYVHALVEYTHNSNAVVRGNIKDDVGLILNPPQSWGKFISPAPLRWLRCQRLKPFVQAKEITPRLLQPKLKDRIFVDTLEIGSGL